MNNIWGNLSLGIGNVAQFAAEAFVERGSGLGDANHQWAAFAHDDYIESGDGEQLWFNLFGELKMVDAMLANDAIDKFVNIGTIGLHDVVGETVGIVSIVVMNAKGGKHAAAD